MISIVTIVIVRTIFSVGTSASVVNIITVAPNITIISVGNFITNIKIISVISVDNINSSGKDNIVTTTVDIVNENIIFKITKENMNTGIIASANTGDEIRLGILQEEKQTDMLNGL